MLQLTTKAAHRGFATARHSLGWSILLLFACLLAQNSVSAQFVPVGSGGYTTTFPGTDAAGRNGYPSGSPQITGKAVGRPVPTNDWWSLLIKNDHVSNLFNYPMALKTTPAGLVVSYIPWGVYDDQEPIVVGVTGLNASRAAVSDYSDWTVTMDFNDGTRQMQATSGIAMPFIYFQKKESDVAQVKVNAGQATVSGEMLLVANARSDADFAFYAPVGSTWTQSGNVYTSTLNGKNYWSMAMLPLSASNLNAVVEEYKQYAYVFPTNTTATWAYDEETSVMKTVFSVETEVKEGANTQMLMGLLPHQWNNLASNSAQPDKHTYHSVRGTIKTMAGNTFSTENTFHGILPTLPYLNNYSETFSVAALSQKVTLLENDGLSAWTDSYNEGQMMNRLIQTARIADLAGDIGARDKMIATVKERLENWLKASPSEVAFLFYYNNTWSALLGYPAGHGQDTNINDHHFHWGYFIHAAAFLEQFEPGWAAAWGDMVNHLVRDASGTDRNDDKFPFLRNFSPYAGHCWANGFATFPQGNDQESTSESMQFNSSLIHWGTITGNKEIRDLGIYLYTTEQTAIEEYWFDMYDRNFAPDHPYSLVSRVWGNSYDNGTFWTADIAASYGIELYPIHGGSLYLGHNTEYVEKLWEEIEKNTGILSNQANVNLWHDVMWEYLAFIDPEKALALYDSYPERELKFGVSDAQTYHWLHAMNVLGKVDVGVTADYPIAAVFSKDGKRTYVAHNYGSSAITVSFSDGYKLEVPANRMATSEDIDIQSTLSSSFDRAYTNGSVDLSLAVEQGSPTKVAFYDGGEWLGDATQAPYTFKAKNLSPGVHRFYAKVYEGEKLGVSNIATVVVGTQQPYGGAPWAIPGTLEAGNYDFFEGGSGQGISYTDVSPSNEGDYRKDEAVDAASVAQEGATIGWINGGEWVSYTVQVQEAGLYELSFRYASANSAGGGPFFLELDGKPISSDIAVANTSGWDKWATKTVAGLPLASGKHILKVAFKNGEFNLGKMTFTRTADLPYSQPVAHAGGNIVVVLPENRATLDGSASNDPAGGSLTYTWKQLFGPSHIVFTSQSVAKPEISALEEGIYGIELTVSNGTHSDTEEVLVIVSPTAALPPTVSISSPANNSSYIEGKPLAIKASAADLDGTVAEVEFFANGSSIGISQNAPFSVDFVSAAGNYELTAVAKDNDGNQATSKPVNVILTIAPPCDGTAHNGDFKYRFSQEDENPTLTFIPSANGVGSPTCILYYGTSASGPFPGYGVQPNVPFRLNAAAGSTIYFYYTYSFPGQGEKNTSGNLISYTIGTCGGAPEATLTAQGGTFSIDEHSAVGTLVAKPTVAYSGKDALTYSIASGNGAGAFKIDVNTGQLSVADSAALDFETKPTFALEVQVTDGKLSAKASFTINLKDIDEVVLGLDLEAIGFKYYPNPVRDYLKIDWRDFQTAQVRDLLGRLVYASDAKVLQLGALPGGTYLLSVLGRNGQEVHLRLVKE